MLKVKGDRKCGSHVPNEMLIENLMKFWLILKAEHQKLMQTFLIVEFKGLKTQLPGL